METERSRVVVTSLVCPLNLLVISAGSLSLSCWPDCPPVRGTGLVSLPSTTLCPCGGPWLELLVLLKLCWDSTECFLPPPPPPCWADRLLGF